MISIHKYSGQQLSALHCFIFSALLSWRAKGIMILLIWVIFLTTHTGYSVCLTGTSQHSYQRSSHNRGLSSIPCCCWRRNHWRNRAGPKTLRDKGKENFTWIPLAVCGAPWGSTRTCMDKRGWAGGQSQGEQPREVGQPRFSLACACAVWLQAPWVKEKLLFQLQPCKGFFPYSSITVSVVPNGFKHRLSG